MTRITIELATRIGAKIDTTIETNTEMTALAKLEAGEKMFTYMMMMKYLTQKLEECKTFYKR